MNALPDGTPVEVIKPITESLRLGSVDSLSHYHTETGNPIYWIKFYDNPNKPSVLLYEGDEIKERS